MRSLARRVLDRTPEGGAALSPREEEILERLGRGENSAEIGQVLGISANTVATYYGRIIKKLNLSSTKDLRKYVLQRRG